MPFTRSSFGLNSSSFSESAPFCISRWRLGWSALLVAQLPAAQVILCRSELLKITKSLYWACANANSSHVCSTAKSEQICTGTSKGKRYIPSIKFFLARCNSQECNRADCYQIFSVRGKKKRLGCFLSPQASPICINWGWVFFSGQTIKPHKSGHGSSAVFQTVVSEDLEPLVPISAFSTGFFYEALTFLTQTARPGAAGYQHSSPRQSNREHSAMQNAQFCIIRNPVQQISAFWWTFSLWLSTFICKMAIMSPLS